MKRSQKLIVKNKRKYIIQHQKVVNNVLLISLYIIRQQEFVKNAQSLLLYGTQPLKHAKNVLNSSPNSMKLLNNVLENHAQLDKNGIFTR
jgi:hypothetical protein